MPELLNLLIADDDSVDRDLSVRIMMPEGYGVDIALNC